MLIESSAKPSLGCLSVSHNKLPLMCTLSVCFFSDTVAQLKSFILDCSGAIFLIHSLEESFYENGVLTSNDKCLLKLENSLLDMSATEALCAGVQYAFIAAYKGHHIVR